MPSSIVEDSVLLRPSARVLCILLFFGGLSLLAIAMSSINRGVEMLKGHSAKERVSSVADSIPEEMSFVLPPITPPKTKEEQIIRARQTENTLNMLLNDAKTDPKLKERKETYSDPKKLIALGVLNGMIHPKEGQRILQEVNMLKLQISNKGKWESPYNDGGEYKKP